MHVSFIIDGQPQPQITFAHYESMAYYRTVTTRDGVVATEIVNSLIGTAGYGIGWDRFGSKLPFIEEKVKFLQDQIYRVIDKDVFDGGERVVIKLKSL